MAKTLFESPLKLLINQLQVVVTTASVKARPASSLTQNRPNLPLPYTILSSNTHISSKKQLRPEMTYQQFAHFASKVSAHKEMKREIIKSPKELGTSLPGVIQNTLQDNNMLSVEKLKQKMKTKTSKSYIVDEKVAGEIATAVMKHRSNPTAPVLEMDAGPCYLSREFLKQGVSRVIALERNPDFIDFLVALQQEAGSDKFHYLPWEMVNVYLKFHSSVSSEAAKAYHRMEIQTAELLQSAFPPQDVSKDVPYSLFCVGGKEENANTIYYFVHSLLNEDVILSPEQVEFFLIVHPRFQAKMDYLSSIKRKTDGVGTISAKQRRQIVRFSYMNVLIFLFYDIQFIGQFEATDFYPPFSTKVAVQDRELECSKRLLIKMQRKKNINDILPVENHAPFLNFLRQVYKKKLLRTIPAMEMLIPGCGLRMIAEGFNMMEKIITTQPEDILRLYKLMQEWPEYRSSPLYNHIMMKTTGSSVEVGGSDAAEEEEDQHV